MLMGDDMRIKYLGRSDELLEIQAKLSKNEVDFVYEDEEYVLKKASHDAETIVGKTDQTFHVLNHQDIVYIESLGNNVIAHTMAHEYFIKEKLYSISSLFEPYGFLRIHKSYVVNIHMIHVIIPQFNRKFTLVMKNKDRIEVSRSYYDSFKEYLRM